LLQKSYILGNQLFARARVFGFGVKI